MKFLIKIFCLSFLLTHFISCSGGGGGPAGDSPPILTITHAPHINIANQANYSLSGTCVLEGDHLAITIGGIPITPAPVCLKSNWSVEGWDTGEIAEGSAIEIVLVEGSSPEEPSGDGESEGGDTQGDLGGEVATEDEDEDEDENEDESGGGTTLKMVKVAEEAEASGSEEATEEATENEVRRMIVKDVTAPVISIDSQAPANPTINLSNQDGYMLTGQCDELNLKIGIIVGHFSADVVCSEAGVWSAEMGLSYWMKMTFK